MKQNIKEKSSQNLLVQIKNLKNVWIGFFEYVKMHSLLGFIMAAVLTICYVGQAFSTYFYIDAEVILNDARNMYNWNAIGRFGLVWMKKLLALDWYNPYLAGGLFLIMLWFAAMSTGYLLSYIDSKVSIAATGIFMLLYLVYPTFAEQFMFQFQAFEVVMALFMLAVANWYFVQFLKEKNIPAFIVSVILLIFSFGIYQTMVNMQLCFYFGIFLFLLIAQKEEKNIIKNNIIFTIVHFLTSFIIYELIVKLFFSQSDYLGTQIHWQYESSAIVIREIINYMLKVFVGGTAFYTHTYKMCVGFLILVIIGIIIVKRKKSIWYVLGGIALAASPFYLAILTGAETVYRAQLMLPFTNAFIFVFCIHSLREIVCFKGVKQLTGIGIILSIILVFLQAAPLMRLFYTRDVIGRSDLITTTQIIEDIYEVPSVFAGKPVVFIGHRTPLINDSCYTFEEANSYLCCSSYELDYIAEPVFYYSTHRILGYYDTLGYYFKRPTKEMVEEAKKESVNMVCWPIDGSIQEFEDYIIVKLSN